MTIDQEPSELMECPCGRAEHAPPAVLDAVSEFAGSGQLLRTMVYDSINDCWMVDYAGMRVGVERDGYIHS